MHPLQQNLRDNGVDATVFGDLVGNVPFVKDVIDPAFGAWIIDTKPVTENEMLVVSEQNYRGRMVTIIGHRILLCHKGPHRQNGNHRAGGTVGGAPQLGHTLDAWGYMGGLGLILKGSLPFRLPSERRPPRLRGTESIKTAIVVGRSVGGDAGVAPQ